MSSINKSQNFSRLDYASWSGLFVYASCVLITGICLPEIKKTLSINLSEGGGLQTAQSSVILVILVLAGILARKWGKKIFITLGQYLFTIGLLSASFADNYFILVLSLMITGFGGGFTEALINPLVTDLHPGDSGKYMNITHAFYSIGAMIATILIGELLTLNISWRWIFRFAACGTLIVGIFFNTSKFPVSIQSEQPVWKLMLKIFSIPVFWMYAAAIFLGTGVEASFGFWSVSYVKTYLSSTPRAGAIALALFMGMMALGRFVTARLSKFVDLKLILIFSSILGIIVSTLVPFITNLYLFYLLVAFAGIATACFWPTVLTEAANKIKLDSTILFVILACIGIAGNGFAPLLLGMVGDISELKYSFMLIPVFFAIMIIIFGIEWWLGRRNNHQ